MRQLLRLTFGRNNILQTAIALIIAALTLTLHAQAQQTTGDLRGRVTDELGGLVVGARVTVTSAASISKSSTTNSEGGYLFSRLAPGKYALRVEAKGFAPFEGVDVEVKL